MVSSWTGLVGWHQVCLRNVAVTCCVSGQKGANSRSCHVEFACLVHKYPGIQVETCGIFVKALKFFNMLTLHALACIYWYTHTHTACNTTKSLSLITALVPCGYANDLLVGALSVIILHKCRSQISESFRILLLHKGLLIVADMYCRYDSKWQVDDYTAMTLLLDNT